MVETDLDFRKSSMGASGSAAVGVGDGHWDTERTGEAELGLASIRSVWGTMEALLLEAPVLVGSKEVD